MDFDFDEALLELTALDDGHNVTEDRNALGQIRELHRQGRYVDTIQAEFIRRQAAARLAGVDDEFYQQIELVNLRSKEANREAQQVGNPETAIRNMLGHNVSLAPDLSEVSAPLCRWQGNDSSTLPVTITLGLETRIAVQQIANSKLRPFATVRWGTGGARFVATVDIGSGRQFTINASMVEVEANLEALTTLPGTLPTANIVGAISFKPMIRTAPLTRTRYVDSAVQNVAQSVTVPDFATELLPLLMSDTSTPGQVQLDFVDSSNATVYSYQITLGAQVTPIPLSGDVRQVNVTNLSLTTQTVRLVFGLSI